jgi:hypothetical protein
MNENRILTPASRLRWDAQKLRDRSRGLALEAYGLLGGGPDYPRRPIYDRIIRAGDRLDQVAAELEIIADELDPEPVSIERAR